MVFSSVVEQKFYEESGTLPFTTLIPYIVVDNFPKLGLLTALRFIEWVGNNPEGTVSLPTGKTPEYFIKWTKLLLEDWDGNKVKSYRERYGLGKLAKPSLKGLHFVQIDEFYPIDPRQTNSFFNYINRFYIKELGLDPGKALLINSDEIPLAENLAYQEVFPDYRPDLSLRYREAKTRMERIQQQSIFSVDNWCTKYEESIRNKGGIGFFLGGIGPDGHIAFNTRGTDLYSTTRLTTTNFETQAQAATDLGGMEISRNRLVITIGLETITYNRDAVALIFAAGESKAGVIKDAIENEPGNLFPATVLQKLPNSRMYITKGASVQLRDIKRNYFNTGKWTEAKSEFAVIELCKKINKYAHRLTLDDLKEDEWCSMIPGLSLENVKTVIENLKAKIARGCAGENNQVYMHTGPHHDDIMLGMLPHVHRLSRNETNKAHFLVLTSGFTAVSNAYILEILLETKSLLSSGKIEMVYYEDFFEEGYRHKWDKDVYHFLTRVASGEPQERRRALCHRTVRALTEIYQVRNLEDLENRIDDLLLLLGRSYDGEKNPPDLQRLKGMIREFEEELVWSHFGYPVKNIHHLRLGFYTGEIFTEQPTMERDVLPVLAKLKEMKPTVISVALDPEGSGPDTHYKVLQTVAEAARLWGKEEDISGIRIWGYRNVWYRFHAAEANVFVPVSLNAMAVMDNAFTNCYLSQVAASFPSYLYDGKFSELAKNIWVEQFKEIVLVLGKEFFYRNTSPRIRTTHGLLFFREMNVDEFLNEAARLRKSVSGIT